MGGEIQVVSTPGSGSVFTFAIRLRRAQVVTAQLPEKRQSGVAAEQALRSEFANCRVLVAEDDWVNQEVALELLSTAGLQANLAVDGKITLDFNFAFNPPCAFTPFALCPLPPPENWLSFAVAAGEKKP